MGLDQLLTKELKRWKLERTRRETVMITEFHKDQGMATLYWIELDAECYVKRPVPIHY